MAEDPGIFISYRRHDTSGHAGRLFDALSARFGASRVFMDIDGIAPGADFWQRITSVIDGCAVVLVVIGDEWLTCANEGHRRLDDPEDFVRREIAAALQRDVTTVPVLVKDAKIPGEHELPDELRGLCRRNAVELSDARWRYDVETLLSAIHAKVSAAEAAVASLVGTSHFQEVAPDDWYRDEQPPRWAFWKRGNPR